jgi:hypothetical protein
MGNFVYVSASTVLRYSSTISYSILAETPTSPVSQFTQLRFQNEIPTQFTRTLQNVTVVSDINSTRNY